MSVAPHTHQELEDRITAEMALVRTEIVALRTDTQRGFTAVVQALQAQGETFRQHGDLLRQILARLPDGDGDDG